MVLPENAALRTPSSEGSIALTRASREAQWRELVAAIASGDRAAMASFYDATHKLVYLLARRILGAGDVAEEVTLDVFMQVWRQAASFDHARGRVSTWLLTLARSRALDRRRTLASRATHERLWSEVLDEQTPDRACAADPAHARTHAERAESVHAAIRALPEAQRQVIELAYFPGLSHSEIAARLGEPLGTIKTRIRLGMIKLKDQLQALEDER